jgi:hypothetical protein
MTEAEAASVIDTDKSVQQLKERIYITFTALAVVLALQSHAHELTAGTAATTLLIAVAGTLLAVFVADFISHTVVHAAVPNRAELGQMLRVIAGAAIVVVIPLVLFGLAALEVMTVETAVRVSSFVLVATLGVVGYLAVRRVKLAFWLKVVLLCVEALLGLAVVALELLAHG